MYLELLARIVLSSSICQVVLHLLFSIRFCRKGMSLILFSSCRFLPPRQMRPHVFLSSTRSDSATLSLFAFILAFPVKVLSINRSDSFSRFVAVRLDRMRCGRCTTWPILQCDREPRCPWHWRSHSFDFLCQFQCSRHHLPRRATQAAPIRHVPWITQCLSRPSLTTHNSTLGNTQNCSCSIIMTKDSLSHAARE